MRSLHQQSSAYTMALESPTDEGDRQGQAFVRLSEFYDEVLPGLWANDPELCEIAFHRSFGNAQAAELGQALLLMRPKTYTNSDSDYGCVCSGDSRRSINSTVTCLNLDLENLHDTNDLKWLLQFLESSTSLKSVNFFLLETSNPSILVRFWGAIACNPHTTHITLHGLQNQHLDVLSVLLFDGGSVKHLVLQACQIGRDSAYALSETLHMCCALECLHVRHTLRHDSVDYLEIIVASALPRSLQRLVVKGAGKDFASSFLKFCSLPCKLKRLELQSFALDAGTVRSIFQAQSTLSFHQHSSPQQQHQEQYITLCLSDCSLDTEAIVAVEQLMVLRHPSRFVIQTLQWVRDNTFVDEASSIGLLLSNVFRSYETVYQSQLEELVILESDSSSTTLPASTITTMENGASLNDAMKSLDLHARVLRLQRMSIDNIRLDEIRLLADCIPHLFHLKELSLYGVAPEYLTSEPFCAMIDAVNFNGSLFVLKVYQLHKESDEDKMQGDHSNAYFQSAKTERYLIRNQTMPKMLRCPCLDYRHSVANNNNGQTPLHLFPRLLYEALKVPALGTTWSLSALIASGNAVGSTRYKH